jgi:putative ABC transport system permease protein
MSAVAKRLEEQFPETNRHVGAQVMVLQERLAQDSRPQLLILLGAVALVLVVACANVANLLLARATVRRREIALRAVLGASRWRLIRQLLTESVMLSVAGAAVGLLGAWWLTQIAQSAAALPIPHENPIQLDRAVLLFTAAVSIAVGILFGLAPALEASRLNLNDELKSSAGTVAGLSGWRGILRSALVVAEISMSLALLIGAGLLLRSFVEMRRGDIGVQSQNILTMAVVLPDTKYAKLTDRRAFCEGLLDRVTHAPGVAAAAVSQQIPLEGSHDGYAALEGETDPTKTKLPVDWNFVTPGYFDTLGIPFLAGRSFTPQEMERSAEVDAKRMADTSSFTPTPRPEYADVAVINATMARSLWPNQDAVGKVFLSGNQPITVVGVVGDVKYGSFREPPQAEAYFPLTAELNNKWYPAEIILRSNGAPESVLSAVRAAVHSLDSELSLFRVRTMQQVVTENMQDTSLQTALLGTFAALGLVLAAVGIYGVMAYLVSQRAHEIGIRMALGALPRDILGLVIGKGLVLTVAGVAIGLAGALGLTRVLASLLYGVKPTDAATYAVVVLLLTAVALVACYVPARRAMRVDPMATLRHE